MPKRAYRPWTATEAARAVELEARGHGQRRIAALLGRTTPDGVSRHLRRAAERAGRERPGADLAASDRRRAVCRGLGWPEVTVPTQARILALLSASPTDLTHRQIAAGLGMRLYGGGRNPDLGKHLTRLRRGLGYVVMLPREGRTLPPRYAVAPWLVARRANG